MLRCSSEGRLGSGAGVLGWRPRDPFFPHSACIYFPSGQGIPVSHPSRPREVSGHLRPGLNAEPHSVSFAGRELLVGAPSVREGALPT